MITALKLWLIFNAAVYVWVLGFWFTEPERETAPVIGHQEAE